MSQFKRRRAFPGVTIGTNFPWTHNNVFSTDPLKTDTTTILVYTVEEIDQLVADKATKTGPTQHENIAILDSSGDLVDSGLNADNLFVCAIDCGTF